MFYLYYWICGYLDFIFRRLLILIELLWVLDVISWTLKILESVPIDVCESMEIVNKKIFTLWNIDRITGNNVCVLMNILNIGSVLVASYESLNLVVLKYWTWSFGKRYMRSHGLLQWRIHCHEFLLINVNTR